MRERCSKSSCRLTRREFLKAASTAAMAGAVLERTATDAFSRTATEAPASTNSRRLLTGWEYRKGGLGGVWEVWKNASDNDILTWDTIGLPHCFNAYDAVDPDTSYYQGQG